MAETVALVDVTNVPQSTIGKCRKRLQDGTLKSYQYTRKCKKSMDCVFTNEAEKLQFEEKIDQVKSLAGVKTHTELIDLLCDKYLSSQSTQSTCDRVEIQQPESTADDEMDLFICSKKQIFNLVEILNDCSAPSLQIKDFSKSGHVGQLKFTTVSSPGRYINWNSSSEHAGNFVINNWMIHSYLCSGMLAAQYERLCKFACIGMPSKRYKDKVIRVYSEVAQKTAEESIKTALDEEERETDKSPNESGRIIDIMTDARHACRTNSFHSDITALGNRTHRVLNYQHVTKKEERSTQKHEMCGVKNMYVEFLNQGVKVRVHAHDRNASVSKYLAQHQPNTTDSYDTWHASKEVKKNVIKVTSGAKRNIDTTWHPQLSDKLSGVKTHTYWAMRNCQGSTIKFTEMLDNISEHYQDKHDKCHPTSRCKATEDYTLSRTKLTSARAIELLRDAVSSLYMYKHPEKYVLCRDTHYIESFHNTVLVYLDKRIHYHDVMYNLRISLAILDWNEHVDREATSTYKSSRVTNPRRRAPHRVLKPKTNGFTHALWREFCNQLENGDKTCTSSSIEGELECFPEITEEDSFIDAGLLS